VNECRGQVSSNIPIPTPSLTEEREEAILFLLCRLNKLYEVTLSALQHYRYLSVACSSLSHWHHLFGAYSGSSEIN
jgi:hypothetical protein